MLKKCMEAQAGLYTIHGSLHIDLSEEAVLDVLTDYDGLSRIYNNIEDSQVLVNGSQKQVLQVCDLLCVHMAAGVMAIARMVFAKYALLTVAEVDTSWQQSVKGQFCVCADM